ncbi:MAG: hypothetical protein AAFP08_05075 [Bacteroidota bacterium]
MPVPTKIELLSILRDGRLDLAIKKLNEATDEYVVEYGLASIRDGYTELVLIEVDSRNLFICYTKR